MMPWSTTYSLKPLRCIRYTDAFNSIIKVALYNCLIFFVQRLIAVQCSVTDKREHCVSSVENLISCLSSVDDIISCWKYLIVLLLQN
uniref:Uncharacterized protein n=1 Tax=Arundo donax TaxID=35708 RepID=A0A0A9G016_ARUDO